MLHLPAERLAALADHSHCPGLEPTPAERSHLALCERCAREVNAYGRLVIDARAERGRVAEPLAPWAGIAAALRSEGLIVDNEAGSGEAGSAVARFDRSESRVANRASGVPNARRSERGVRWAGRAAAALMFVAAGAVAGRATGGGGTSANGSPAASHDTLAAASVGIVRNVGLLVADTAARFASTAEALTALSSAERQYERAAAFLVEHDSSSQPTDSSQLYKARLAALDNVMAATREALYDAPHDPLINRYYLATMGAREATLRQLGTALPQGERISRY